jgi:glucose-1-phosphate thymidylyltransferase
MGNIDKCVILARGLGKRMRADDATAHLNPAQTAAADSGIKALVQVGRPFLDYSLSVLADAGFTHICLVIGPEHEAVRNYYTQAVQPRRIQIDFAVQTEPLGTADAVLAAEEFIGPDEALVLNSDNYYPLDVLLDAQRLAQPGAVLFDAAFLVRESNIPLDRIRAFGSCVIDTGGFLVDIVEKPDNERATPVKLISMNCWRFSPEIFRSCREAPLSPRGEYELPLAVKLALQRGMRLKACVSHSGILDLSRRSDIDTVAARLEHVQVQL